MTIRTVALLVAVLTLALAPVVGAATKADASCTGCKAAPAIGAATKADASCTGCKGAPGCAETLTQLQSLLQKAGKAADDGQAKDAAALIAQARTLVDKQIKRVQADKQAGIVNKRCPIMGADINPDKVSDNLKRTYKGKTVGFCCAGCPAAWDKLSARQKAKKLSAASK